MMSDKMMGRDMPSGPPMAMGMPMCAQCRMGDPVRALCRVDLGTLGLPDDTRKTLEDKRFELRKTVIRKKAELAIQRLELQRLLGNKDFDVEAAQASVRALADLEGEIEAAHLAFLHDVGAQLTEEQWHNLPQAGAHAGMMPMMGGGGMMQGMMSDGPPGQRMPCGMMMPPAGPMEHTGHHSGSSDEAEEFFKNE